MFRAAFPYVFLFALLISLTGCFASSVNTSSESTDGSDRDPLLNQIEVGVDINAVINSLGDTQLHRAIKLDQPVLAAELIEKGADIHLRDGRGNTPLLLAAKRNQSDLVTILLVLKANPFARNDNGFSAYYYLTSPDFDATFQSGFILEANTQGMVEELAKTIEAIKQHDHDALREQLAIEQFAWYRSANEHGWLLSHYAVAAGCAACVEILEQAGFDLNRPMKPFGETPLSMAVGFGSLPLVDLLLSLGANPSIEIEDRESTPLIRAVGLGHEDIVERLARYKQKLNFRTNWGGTALSMAVGLKHPRAFRALLEAGADPLIADHERITPLMIASGYGPLEFVEQLAQLPYTLNMVSSSRATALHAAAIGTENVDNEFSGKAAEILIEAGAKVNVIDEEGQSPLHYAVQFKSMAMLKVLLENGSDTSFRDDDGRTAEELALDKENHEAVAMIRDHNAKMPKDPREVRYISETSNVLKYPPEPRHIECRTTCVLNVCSRTYADGKRVTFMKRFHLSPSMPRLDYSC